MGRVAECVREEGRRTAGDSESFTFTDRLYVRIGDEKVEASGGLLAMRLKVSGRPRLILNGKEQPARVEGGCLQFGRAP